MGNLGLTYIHTIIYKTDNQDLLYSTGNYTQYSVMTYMRKKHKRCEFQENIYFCLPDYTKALTVWITTNWKILKEKGIPYHLTCLLRNLYTGQEAAIRTSHGTKEWFKIGKGVCQGYILSTSLFNLYAEYLMQKARLDE